MKIVAVRIGNRYGIEYEEYLEKKLSKYEIIWIREEMDPKIKLQWNKLQAISIKTSEPICVIDIDILLINNYLEIFEHPIERGQVLTMPKWWSNPARENGIITDERLLNYTINGGFYKYYPQDCEYILEKFLENPLHYQSWYINQQLTTGPVNGEQHFMEDSFKERLDIIKLPEKWFARIDARPKEITPHSLAFLNSRYKTITKNPFMFVNGEFHPDVKFVHFTNMNNLPHNWKFYNLFK